MTENAKKMTIKQAFALAGIKRHETRTVKLSELEVDVRYQRPLNMARVLEICENFSAPVAQNLVVNRRRKDGRLYCVDGWHRKTALERLGFTHWSAAYTEGLDSEGEARLWRTCNTARKNATALEKFKCRLHLGEEAAVTIKAAVEAEGFVLRTSLGSKNPDDVQCVAALDEIYARTDGGGADLIRDIFRVIRWAWSDYQDPAAQSANVIRGMARFLSCKRWRGKVDLRRLARKLGGAPASRYLKQTQALAEAQQRGIVKAFAVVVYRTYNKNLRGRARLPIPGPEWME